MTGPASVAIVTGGSGGLAPGVVAALAGAGMTVIVTARRAAPLQAAAAARTGPGRVVPIVSDVRDPESVRALVSDVLQRFGRIDLLVNMAACSNPIGGPIETVDIDELVADFNTKVGGYLRFAQAVVPAMKSAGGGRIVNVGGLTGRSSDTLSGLRNVAVTHLTKVLSDQLAPHGIAVNAIHPGLVRTPHLAELFADLAARRGCDPGAVEREFIAEVPAGELLDPADIGRVVLFLAEAAGHTINGESITVDGGYARGVFL